MTLRRVLRCLAGGPALKAPSGRSRPLTAAAATASDPATLTALQAQADRPDLQGRRARAWELLTLGAQIPGDVARQVTVAQARSGLAEYVIAPLPPAMLTELREVATGPVDGQLFASGPVEPGISLPPDPASSEAEPDPWEYLDGHRARRLVLGGLLGSESPFSTVAACYSHGSPLDHGRLLNGFANALSWAC